MSRLSRRARLAVPVTAALVATLALAACGASPGGSAGSATQPGAVSSPAGKVTLRLGYFPNLTHATALVGVHDGLFAQHLGPDVTLRTSLFSAGPAAVEALFSGAIDATYIGPNPAINAYVKSNGGAVRIISGATSGGALLVVAPAVHSASDLRGRKVATPQLGNTQDVALRTWLKKEGLATTTTGGGDVPIVPESNAQTIQAFDSGAIAGAWVPEPYATEMVDHGHGHVLVDERSLWPGGQFATTALMVRTAFLDQHPDVVKALLEGQVATTDFMRAHPAAAVADANAALAEVTGRALPAAVIDAAWKNLTFTDDPLASTFRRGATNAAAVKLGAGPDGSAVPNLDHLFDLTPLNQVLAAHHEPAVKS